MQRVPALDVERVAAQLAEARDAPDVGRDVELLLEQLGGREHLAQDRARAEQLHAQLALPAGAQRIHAAQDALGGSFGQRGMGVVLVHRTDVIEDVFLIRDHPPQAVLDDDRELVRIARVVRAAVRDRGGDELAVPVLMLETFARERRAAGGTANQEAARAAVAAGPRKVADPLEAEHRVVDIERNRLHAVRRVRRARRDPRAVRTALVDALFEDLAFLVLFIERELVGVLRRVELPSEE